MRSSDHTPAIPYVKANGERIVALAGNPNVGKSTVFNALTGMHQHTGNWPGKTVTNARGVFESKKHRYTLVDIPGTYSLLAHSAEEEVARNFICFGEPDATVIVCDATCLERNLNLVLQILECTPCAVVCVNLLDEAKRKKIRLDLSLLQKRLGVPVVGTVARKKKSLAALTDAIDRVSEQTGASTRARIDYPAPVEEAVRHLLPLLQNRDLRRLDSRWLALKLLDRDAALTAEIQAYLGDDFLEDAALIQGIREAYQILEHGGIDREALRDITVTAAVQKAESICQGVVLQAPTQHHTLDRRLDAILTGKFTAYPIMLLLLAMIFWLTITGANYPSQWLSSLFRLLQTACFDGLTALRAPPWLCSVLADGVIGVLGWVISVMLPPMAIFFPLFTLLEDAGYLPRVAYNLDRSFQRCNACGKQALTMCMGFGCNAAGVVGCRIIDSPRERLMAILTNSLVPCNGRFPALISILTIFFIGFSGGIGSSLLSALLLTLLILLGIFATFAMTKLLSKTLLRGIPSSFVLEMPPYRKPQIGRVLVRSVLDRTLFVLGRSAAVAAPAGLLIWIMANVTVADTTLLAHCAAFLDPFAALMGMDGVILMAFLLGSPANEIVIPIMIMAYLRGGYLTEFDSLLQMRELFVANGWTPLTAICVLIFFLMHWPCTTTLLTVKKETGSWKWTLLAALLPTALGMLLCMALTAVWKLLGLG